MERNEKEEVWGVKQNRLFESENTTLTLSAATLQGENTRGRDRRGADTSSHPLLPRLWAEVGGEGSFWGCLPPTVTFTRHQIHSKMEGPGP